MENNTEATKTEATKRDIDSVSDAEIFQEAVALFGPKRFLELLGWCIVSGIVSEFVADGSPAVLRRQMEARGFTSSAIYRALADLRRLGEHIEGRPYPVQDHRPTLRVMDRLSKVRTA
jgi:hypothetical protein